MSMIAEDALIRKASPAIFLKRYGPVVTAAEENLDILMRQAELDAVAIELDFVDPPIPGRHFNDGGRQRRGSLSRALGTRTLDHGDGTLGHLGQWDTSLENGPDFSVTL
jgi:hypothetical protein